MVKAVITMTIVHSLRCDVLLLLPRVACPVLLVVFNSVPLVCAV
jgi:hypothetical protein